MQRRSSKYLFWYLVILVAVTTKNVSNTKCEFCNNEFQAPKKHARHCKAKVTNFNKHENSQNDALTTGNSIVAIDVNDNRLNESCLRSP